MLITKIKASVKIKVFYQRNVKQYNCKSKINMKQDVLNYETDLSRRESQSGSNFKRQDLNSFRYQPWTLQDTINRFIGQKKTTIKWIGNDQNANILSFFYTALQGCLHEDHRSEEFFLKFKYSLYQESKDTLSLGEQKTFVEHLCLLSYSKDIGQFLKKSSQLEGALLKIFRSKHRQMLAKNFNAFKSANPQNKIEQLQWFCSFFPFMHYQILSEKCGKVIVNNKIFFIVEQSQCRKCSRKIHQPILSIKNPKCANGLMKIRSHEHISNPNYFEDQVKEFERARRTSHTQNNIQFKINPKKDRKFKEDFQNQQSETNREEIYDDFQSDMGSRGFNILDCIREIQLTIDKQIQDDSGKLRGTRSFKELKSKNNILIESLRSSLKKSREKKDVTRPLKRYQQVFHNVSSPQSQLQQLEDSQPETVKKQGTKRYNRNSAAPQAIEWTNQRDQFIHQSLGAKQSAAGNKCLFEKGSPKVSNKKFLPEFLASKKGKQFVQLTPNLTPTKRLGKVFNLESRNSKHSPIFNKKCSHYQSIPIFNPNGLADPSYLKLTPMISQMPSGVSSPISSPRAMQPTSFKFMKDYQIKDFKSAHKNQ